MLTAERIEITFRLLLLLMLSNWWTTSRINTFTNYCQHYKIWTMLILHTMSRSINYTIFYVYILPDLQKAVNVPRILNWPIECSSKFQGEKRWNFGCILRNMVRKRTKEAILDVFYEDLELITWFTEFIKGK